MTYVPEWCGICKGRKPRYFCTTENRYICSEDINFCHRMAHNWKELGSDKEGVAQVLQASRKSSD